uniref:Uncharacterized protein n=1 Tax=Rhizophora mucronata TaxID=61149 RepID=A0A2P2NKA1_RHIMU
MVRYYEGVLILLNVGASIFYLAVHRLTGLTKL